METTVPEQTTAFILGVDPGTTTGLTVICLDLANDGKPLLVEHSQHEWSTAASLVNLLTIKLGRWQDTNTVAPSMVAAEKYTINAQTAQRGQAGADDAMGMLGIVRHACERNHVILGKHQSASAAKALVSDPTLKALDLYIKGKKHANDATRHAVHLAHSSGQMHRRWLAAALL